MDLQEVKNSNSTMHPCAEIIKDDFKNVKKYCELLDLQSDFKHSCAISDMVWRGLRDTPYTCGYDTLAGRSSMEDRERAI